MNFLEWKKDSNIREIAILRRYHVQDREDYAKYNKLVGQITKLVAKLKTLKQNDTYRIAKTDQLANKLFEMGVVNAR